MKIRRSWSLVLAALALAAGLIAPQARAQCASEANVFRFTYEGVRYEIVKEAKSWTAAAACAVERGGFLAEIDSLGEQSAIFTAILDAGVADDYNPIETGGGASYVWIGGTDRVTEGSWIWDGDNSGSGIAFWDGDFEGSAVEGRYNNWGTDKADIQAEPDNSGNQDAVGIGLSDWPVGAPFRFGGTGQWNDIAEGSLCYFVVEGADPPPPGVSITSISPPYGSTEGGTLVSISGYGFDPDESTIRFGDNFGAILSVSEEGTSMVVITPAAFPVGTLGDVTVTVDTPKGSASVVNGFRYWPRPVVTTISPASGPTTGGTTLTINGLYFLSDAMVVSIGGADAEVLSVNAAGTSLTAVTPAGVAGLKSVEVSGPGGTRIVPNGFTYADVPTIVSVGPSDGSVNGGALVTIIGTGFVAGQTTVKFGTSSASVVTVVTTDRLTARTTPGSAGLKNVTVTTLAGTATAVDAWTYRPVPTVASVAPASGPTTGGTAVTLAGTGFVAGSTAVRIGGVPATAVVVNGAGTSLTAVTGASTSGRMSVSVSTVGGTGTKANAFTYLPVPTISSISPNSGPIFGGTRIDIIGSNFFPGGTTVKIDNKFCAVLAVNASGTRVRAVTPPGVAGPRNVVVTTFAGSSAPGTYTYTVPPGGPIHAPPGGFRSPRGAEPASEFDAPVSARSAPPLEPAWAPDTGVPAVDEFIVEAAWVPTVAAACGGDVPDLDSNGDGELDLCQLRRGDLDLDGDCDASDVGLLMGLVGRESPDGIGDVDGDGLISLLDVLEGLWAHEPRSGDGHPASR